MNALGLRRARNAERRDALTKSVTEKTRPATRMTRTGRDRVRLSHVALPNRRAASVGQHPCKRNPDRTPRCGRPRLEATEIATLIACQL